MLLQEWKLQSVSAIAAGRTVDLAPAATEVNVTDRTRQWVDLTKTYGLPTAIALVLLWWIVVPITQDYRDVVRKTVEIQQQTATTLQKISEIQTAQTRTLEELTRLTQRSSDCLQRVETAVRELDSRSRQPRSP
jgi:hypothetical protein